MKQILGVYYYGSPGQKQQLQLLVDKGNQQGLVDTLRSYARGNDTAAEHARRALEILGG